MEPEGNSESASEAEDRDQNVSFARITAVATEWMLDFMFVSLCQRFKEGNVDEFNDTLSAFEAIAQVESLKESAIQEKTLICAFLARVMHGRDLDVAFDQDESVLPLMSAAKVWSDLKHTVDDESLFKSITVLLLAQAVAVCLEKDQASSASSAIEWFEKHCDFPQNLQVKLSTVVAKMDTNSSFFTNFSFNRLTEVVQSYLDAYLKKNPSDYILKAATKAVQSSQDLESLEEEESQEEAFSQTSKELVQKKKRRKRKLLSTIADLWDPGTVGTPCVSIRRLCKHELLQMASPNSLKTTIVYKKRKTPKKWTPQLDSYLKEGVKRHGEGKWALILKDYDFEGRTGTMLKDRWRTLLKSHKVG